MKQRSGKKQLPRPFKKPSNMQSKIVELEEELLKFFKDRKIEMDEKDKDCDYHLLMYLLPQWKNVKQERKLLVQTQLLKVLFNEINSYNIQTTNQLLHPNLSVVSPRSVSYAIPTPSPVVSQTDSNDFSSSPPASPTPLSYTRDENTRVTNQATEETLETLDSLIDKILA